MGFSHSKQKRSRAHAKNTVGRYFSMKLSKKSNWQRRPGLITRTLSLRRDFALCAERLALARKCSVYGGEATLNKGATWSEAWCFAPAFTASDLCGLSASTLSLLVRLYKYFASSWPFFARYFWFSQLLLSLRLPDLGGFRPHPHSRGQVSSRSDCHPCVFTWCEYRVSPFPH